MARLAVFASGNGSNFECLVEALRAERRHECVILVHDRATAFAAERARKLAIPARHVTWAGRRREEAESEVDACLRAAHVDLIALAGFMRVLSPDFVASWQGRIVNVHPSILPAWPGADAIHRAFEAGDKRFGISIHFVDEGMDTGPLIAHDEFQANTSESEAEIVSHVHRLEHRLYPKVVLEILDRMESEGKQP